MSTCTRCGMRGATTLPLHGLLHYLLAQQPPQMRKNGLGFQIDSYTWGRTISFGGHVSRQNNRITSGTIVFFEVVLSTSSTNTKSTTMLLIQHDRSLVTLPPTPCPRSKSLKYSLNQQPDLISYNAASDIFPTMQPSRPKTGSRECSCDCHRCQKIVVAKSRMRFGIVAWCVGA